MGNNRKNKQKIEKTEAIVQALDNTGVLMFRYFPQERKVVIPETTRKVYHCDAEYGNMPDGFAENIVHPDDYAVFKDMYYRIDSGDEMASSVFRSKDPNYCAKVTLTTVAWAEDGQPDEVIGFIEDRSDAYRNEKFISQLQEKLAVQNSNAEMDDALKTIATSIGTQYYAVYYIWLESRTYVCFQEYLEGILDVIGERGDFETAWDKYIEGYIEEHDQAGIREFIEISTLAERIGHKNSISHVYRRKEVGWTRGKFLAGKRDDNGNLQTVIYTVADINEEMEMKRRKSEAEHEAMLDSLTGLWNRKAFEQYKQEDEFSNRQMGFMMMDVDRFKSVNDQYGHDMGDRVLISVANHVKRTLRQDDLIFRMGGDEFAVLLHDCNESAWDSICHKVAQIHMDVKEELPDYLDITLSAGLCMNAGGYCEDMFAVADKAMYNTKSNGRGGCTLMNLSGEIVKEWHDKSGFLRKGDVLEKNSTVTWRLDKPKKEGLPFRAYGDRLFMGFVGADDSCTPEDLYNAWAERVESDYFDIIREAAKAAITDGRSEVVCLWRHPQKGVIQLRCSATFDTENSDYHTLIGYIHVITGTRVFTLEDISDKIRIAMEELYYCSFYIRLSDHSFRVYKAQEYMVNMLGGSNNASEVIEAYIENMVAEESKETMTEFLNLATLKQRMKDANVISTNYNDPNIGWSCARFVSVERSENGEVETVSLVVEPLESQVN